MHDPERQSDHNLAQVDDAQQTLFSGNLPPPLKEFALQGTSLRELLVPSLDAIASKKPISTDDTEEDSTPLALLQLSAHDSQIDIANSTLATTTTASNPSSLLMDNQLIRSWVRRYEREDPITMIGDPDIALNPSQTRAVAMALSERLSLIQGVSFSRSLVPACFPSFLLSYHE